MGGDGVTNSTGDGLPPYAVDRDDLVHRVRTAAKGKLTSIVAPAGFGKTTLLRQWAKDPGEVPVSVVKLDERDNDGRRLTSRLLTALQQIDGGIGTSALDRVDRSGRTMGDGYLAQLLDEMASCEPGVLVLDELDTLTSTRLHLDLRALVHYSPSSVGFVVATRSEPEQPWLAPPSDHLGQADLAFDRADAALLLGRHAGQALTDDQLDGILAKTEGWPAALQLVGLALRDGAEPEALIESLDGTDRFIGAYLTNEVLARQPEEIRRFLLQTSVLRRLSAPLCDAVAGPTGGDDLLAAVERRSMFLVPLDETGEWFRFHRLFQDLTRHELRSTAPELEPGLLRTAADWHLAHGDLEAGVAYLVEAHEWERVIDLIMASSKHLFEQGAPHVVLRWMEQVPSVLRAGRTDVQLTEAILHTLVGATVQAQDIMDDLVRSGSLTPGELLVTQAVRATWVQHHLSPEASIEAGDDVLRGLAQDPPVDVPDLLGLTGRDHLEFLAHSARARARWYRGDLDQAQEELEDLAASELGYPPWRINALGGLALLHAWSGRLHDAHEIASQALVIATRAELTDHQSTGEALLALASVTRQRGQHGRSELLLGQALPLAARIHRSALLAVHAVERAALDLAEGEPGRGLERIWDFLASGETRPPELLTGRLLAMEARLQLAAGDLDGARRAVGTVRLDPTAELTALRVQLAVRDGDTPTARQAIDGWRGTTPHADLERRLWTAMVEDLEGDRARAHRTMAAALTLAETEGDVRVFADAGPDVRRFLQTLARSHPSAHLDRILRHHPVERPRDQADGHAALSPRELVVLRYLPSQLTNAELAAQLYVSHSTVKTHLRSIYRRLGVSGRREAVEAAERLGLL